MRVAFVAETFLPSINGVTNSVLRMLEYLRSRSHDAIIIASSDPRGVPESYEGFPVETFPSVTLPWYSDVRLSAATTTSIERTLERFHPDVCHLAAPMVLGHRGMTAATRLGIPTVALYQTEVPQYAAQYGYAKAEPLLWHYMRHLHNMATINLAPSSYTKAQLDRQGFSRVDVWGRGVDTRRFSPAKRDEALHRSWAPNGEVIIGYMGRLGAEKRVQDLAILANIPGARLVIIGDGPERDDLERRLPSAVFTGMLTGDELPRNLASLDLFVHPGELETFGQAIQEAQASGLPTIAPRKGGPIDLIESSHNGWLYPPGDLLTLRDYVIDLVGDDTKRAQFGKTARSRVESRTWPHLCAQLENHYRRAIKLGGGVEPELIGSALA